jgi:hypothetical protein
MAPKKRVAEPFPGITLDKMIHFVENWLAAKLILPIQQICPFSLKIPLGSAW